MPYFVTPAPTHGNLDTIQQTRIGQLSGGEAAKKILTTDDSAFVVGNLLTTDGDGNVVDAGVSASGVGSGGGGTATTHAEALTDGNSNLVFASGDLVYVVGIPN